MLDTFFVQPSNRFFARFTFFILVHFHVRLFAKYHLGTIKLNLLK